MFEQDDQRLNDRLRAHLDRVTKRPAPLGFERGLMNIAIDRRPPIWRNRLARLAVGTATAAAFAAVAGLALWSHQAGGPGHAGGAGRPTSGTPTVHADGVGTTDAGITVPVSLDFRDLVTGLNVRPGDQVRRGQQLIAFDPQAFRVQAPMLQAKLALLASEVQSTQARLDTANRNGDSAQAVSLQQQINGYQAQSAIAQGQVAIAEGRAPVILSPIDGVVGSVNIQPGAFASPGEVLLAVLDLSHIRVTATLPVSSQTFATNGAPAEVTIPGMSGVVLRGQVIQIEPGASGDGKSITAIIDAPNTSDRRVIPGMQVQVRVSAGPAGTK